MNYEVTIAGRDLAPIPYGAAADSAAVAVLLAWSATASQKAAYSENTWRAYRASWGAFCAWATEQGHLVLPAAPGHVAAFLEAESAAGRAVGTIRHRAVTISVYHHRAKLSDPCEQEEVRLTLRGIAKTRGTDQRQAEALNRRDADHITATVFPGAGSPKELRDLALMLVGRDLLARASELVSITLEAVSFDEEDETATVMVRRRKTETEAKPCHLGPEAAEALRLWVSVLKAQGIETGPVFVSLTKHGTIRRREGQAHAIDVRDIGRVLKLLGRRIGNEKFSAHSLRVGMAQDLTAANVSTAAVMEAGNWSSPSMVARYTRKQKSKRGAVAQYYASQHK
jgi:site-specific recombinase XerD